MFIKYSGTNVHAIGMVNKTNLKLNQSPQEVRGLQPGWNEVPKALWDQNKTQPDIVKMLKTGKLEILKDQVNLKVKGPKGKPVTKKIAIGEYDKSIKLRWIKDEKRAIEIVKDTYNRDILQRWEEEEVRLKVRKALKKQIEPLLNTERDEDDEGDSDDDDVEEFD